MVTATATFDSLSEDVLIHIQGALASPRDLHAFISASPRSLRAFLLARRQVLTSVLRNSLAPAVLPHALAVVQIPRIPPITVPIHGNHPRRARETIPIIQPFLEKYFANELSDEMPSGIVRIIGFAKLLALVNRFVDEYALHGARRMGLELDSDQFPPTSDTERARMQRAFFRYELYSRVFMVSGSGIDSADQGKFFFSKLEAWEAEEIVHAHYYLASLTGEVIDDLQERVVQAALAAPGAKSTPVLGPYFQETDERYTTGIMTWGRLPGGVPVPVRRHPQPRTRNQPLAQDDSEDVSSTQGQVFVFNNLANLDQFGLGVLGDNHTALMHTYITSLATLGLEYMRNLVSGDDNRRNALLHTFNGRPYDRSHLDNFAFALDMAQVMNDVIPPAEHPAEQPSEPGVADNPCCESTGFRIIRPHGGPGEPPREVTWIGERYFATEPLRETGCIFWDSKRFLAPQFMQIIEDMSYVPEGTFWIKSRVERESLTRRLRGLSLPLLEMILLAVNFGSAERASFWAQFLIDMGQGDGL